MNRAEIIEYVNRNFTLDGGVAGRMLDNILLYGETHFAVDARIKFLTDILGGTMGLTADEIKRFALPDTSDKGYLSCDEEGFYVCSKGEDVKFWGIKGEDIRIEWVRLGEGYNGDYDPEDPEDTELLRFDVFEKDDDGMWFDEASESRCTWFAAAATEKQQKAALKQMLADIEAELDSMRLVCDRLSHICESKFEE